MPSPRARRLYADREQLDELSAAGRLQYIAEGDPPEVYRVAFEAPGLCCGADGQLALRQLHRATISLHLEYPRLPPVVTWQTPIFHPNVLGPERHGGVCLGAWSPSESLADLCCRLIRMASYEVFNVEDALDPRAAEWARGAGIRPGENLDALVARLATIAS